MTFGMKNFKETLKCKAVTFFFSSLLFHEREKVGSASNLNSSFLYKNMYKLENAKRRQRMKEIKRKRKNFLMYIFTHKSNTKWLLEAFKSQVGSSLLSSFILVLPKEFSPSPFTLGRLYLFALLWLYLWGGHTIVYVQANRILWCIFVFFLVRWRSFNVLGLI